MRLHDFLCGQPTLEESCTSLSSLWLFSIVVVDLMLDGWQNKNLRLLFLFKPPMNSGGGAMGLKQ